MVWNELLATHVDVGKSERAVASSEALARAWIVMGDLLAASLRANPRSTAIDVHDVLVSLNPEDVGVACRGADPTGEEFEIFCRLARFSIETDVLDLAGRPKPVFALAVRYSYFGRLLVVSADGVASSENIGRCGAFTRLPDARDGQKRFAIDSHCNDWPTSRCGGGRFNVWQWDGRRVRLLTQRRYGAPRCSEDARWDHVHARGRWIKLYVVGARTLSDSCGGGSLEQLAKIRLDPDGIRVFGPRFVSPEFQLADELMDRVRRVRPIRGMASDEAAERLRALMGSKDWRGMICRCDRAVTSVGRRLTIHTDGAPAIAFTTVSHPGRRPVVVEVAEDSTERCGTVDCTPDVLHHVWSPPRRRP